MIIAKFCSDGQYYKTVFGLVQWDYGQTLQVFGLQIPDQTEVHLTEEFGTMLLQFPETGRRMAVLLLKYRTSSYRAVKMLLRIYMSVMTAREKLYGQYLCR